MEVPKYVTAGEAAVVRIARLLRPPAVVLAQYECVSLAAVPVLTFESITG